MISRVAFDIDGTLADARHRAHLVSGAAKDWLRYFDAAEADSPIMPVIDLACALGRLGEVIYVTARPETHREPTGAWLARFGLPAGPLYMRAADAAPGGDPAKRVLIARVAAAALPSLAFDDRADVVAAWAAVGVRCLLVPPSEPQDHGVRLWSRPRRTSRLHVRGGVAPV